MIGTLLNNLDKKYAFGLLTGLVFGLLSVYTDFFRSTSPQIQFDILSNTTVVDIKENIGKIDILYDSTSILSKKQTLSLITLKIANNGNSDVTKNYYDNRFPLGFKIDNGVILEKPTLIQSSNNYIKESIGLTLTSKNQNIVSFTDFIFEKDDYFVLKILVLHNVNEHPEIVPKGKVAGVKKISISKSYLSKETKTFWQRVFDGSVLIHITRFFTYIFSFGLFAILIVLPISLIGNTISTKKRKGKLREFKIHLRREFSDSEKFIADFFINNGIDALKLFKIIASQYRKYRRIFEVINPTFEPRLIINHREQRRPYEMAVMELIKALKEKQYVLVDDGKLIFKDNLDSFINQLISFIERE